ncbi:LLM class F420-dependent oxidoreductase [Luedemannella helvata]|uniref:LLM class F420-dependent oxidoreductase n=1 Tax=Luedemannella helvata TaxID=349315 RepID=A0ABN2KVB1_9ACTN
MRLALNLGHHAGAGNPAEHRALAQAAERLGYVSVWVAEAYGSDAATVLAWLAAHTDRIGLGSAIMQIPARTPAMTAMTAATLDLLSGGRFHLGLGVSGPQVSEGWHGAAFGQPMARTRDYVGIVRQALRREKLAHPGPHYPLPRPGGEGKPLRMSLHPPRADVPVYLAAVGPRSLELAGELADGWLAAFCSPEHTRDSLLHVAAGRSTAGRDLAGFDVVPTVPVVIGDDVEACARAVRGYAALYLGGMGSRTTNFYHRHATRMGFGTAVDRVQDLYLAGRRTEAAAAVPVDLIDATSLLGPQARITRGLDAYARAGVTTLAACLFDRGTAARVDTLERLAVAAASLGADVP